MIHIIIKSIMLQSVLPTWAMYDWLFHIWRDKATTRFKVQTILHYIHIAIVENITRHVHCITSIYVFIVSYLRLWNNLIKLLAILRIVVLNVMLYLLHSFCWKISTMSNTNTRFVFLFSVRVNERTVRERSVLARLSKHFPPVISPSRHIAGLIECRRNRVCRKILNNCIMK